jgi:hypothetical protein
MRGEPKGDAQERRPVRGRGRRPRHDKDECDTFAALGDATSDKVGQAVASGWAKTPTASIQPRLLR